MSKINSLLAKCKHITTWDEEGEEWLSLCPCTKRNYVKTKQQKEAQEKLNEAKLVKALNDLNHEIESSYRHLPTSMMETEFSKFIKRRLRVFCPNKYQVSITNMKALDLTEWSLCPDPPRHISNPGDVTDNSEQEKIDLSKHPGSD